jgi:AcrR family transcriptional regulator
MALFTDMKVPKRPYRMRARAENAAETGQRIAAAMRELAVERFLDDITLDDVAERAGVATRTVIRRFGGRDGLIEAAFAEASSEVAARRDEIAVGDVGSAVEAVFEDYERYGDALIMALAQERRHPDLLRRRLDIGRRDHWNWVARVFAPRDQLHAAQLIAATDVYVWKLLRRDMRLSLARAKMATAEMVGRLA